MWPSPVKSTPPVCAVPMVSLENIGACNIILNEQVTFWNTSVFPYRNVITISEKVAMNLKERVEGTYWRVWREETEGKV